MTDKGNKKNKIKNIIKNILFVFLGVFILLVAFLSGASLAVENNVVKKVAEKNVIFLGRLSGKYSKVDNQIAQNIDFGLYWDVWDAMKELYVDKDQISDKQLFYGSLKGLVNSLEDPYSEFMDPQLTKEFEEDMSGSFEGIGAEIGIRDGILTVIAPLEGTPAQKAGLMSGDKILEINGESTKDMNIDQAVSKIRGPKGTEVVLNIFRTGLEDFKDINIIRDTIVIKSVSLEILDNNIFLIKINAFNDDTEYLFSDFAKQAFDNKAKGVILDLRNNPGGYLETSVNVLGEWINGEVALAERFTDGHEMEYIAKGNNYLKDIPTVVLINYGSASASEIVSGALQDYGKAKIIGEKSYGKGSVQMVKNIKDGSSLKITIAKWLTPKGQDINKEGIKPDEEVKLSLEDFENDIDNQLNRALEILNQ
ncbi:MAG TPA: S41 family peptidase [bacterium]|nr:S41 family peptidase [bacterium]HPV65229.1 S41 family peptidase [bacterium]